MSCVIGNSASGKEDLVCGVLVAESLRREAIISLSTPFPERVKFQSLNPVPVLARFPEGSSVWELLWKLNGLRAVKDGVEQASFEDLPLYETVAICAEMSSAEALKGGFSMQLHNGSFDKLSTERVQERCTVVIDSIKNPEQKQERFRASTLLADQLAGCFCLIAVEDRKPAGKERVFTYRLKLSEEELQAERSKNIEDFFITEVASKLTALGLGGVSLSSSIVDLTATQKTLLELGFYSLSETEKQLIVLKRPPRNTEVKKVLVSLAECNTVVVVEEVPNVASYADSCLTLAGGREVENLSEHRFQLRASGEVSNIEFRSERRIDCKPIPRTSLVRYLDCYLPIREIFSSTKLARAQGLKAKDFTTSDKENFLFKGRNIYQALELNFLKALDVFSFHPKLQKVFSSMVDLGLGDFGLDHSTVALSDGEVQLLKFVRVLAESSHKDRLYIFEDPTFALGLDEYDKFNFVADKISEAGGVVSYGA